ncbi:hypothetical protein [Runella sp.]|jgi:hypothetical protein|uniref:monooxygenase n=1 Tax=Runella sp. TaxID=1960881 RepID=UPI003017C311
MKRAVFVFWIITTTVLAQKKLTFYEHIQPIIAKNCAICHRPGGIGPFSLLTYEDVAKRSKFVAKVTQIKYMPPFPADRSFQHYANERGLKEEEIELIQQWVAQGSIEGKSVKRKKEKGEDIDARMDGPALAGMTKRAPDLILKMQNAFTVPNTGIEEFRYFHVPTGLKEEVKVEAIEFLPGNRKVVHHSRVMVDTSGHMGGLEGMHGTDPKLAEFQRIPMADEFLYGWVPGNDRIQFPEGVAKKIKANSNLILYLHYSPSATVQTDQSEINLYFSQKPVEREVKSLILHEQHITNPPFLIKANEKSTFYMSTQPLKEDISAISVLPHMHFLGKTFKAFAITPDGDLVPFIKIDNWDFNWQMTYQFDSLLHVPKGSVILAEATYDNTEENPLNPFKPARDTTFGWNTTSEMMEMVIYYVSYLKGDEKVKQAPNPKGG